MINHKKARLINIISLVFCLLIAACTNRKAPHFSIYWEGSKPTGIVIPYDALENSSIDSLQIVLNNNSNSVKILGEFTRIEDTVLFKPLIPLTRGLKYKIQLGNQVLGELEVPQAEEKDLPVVLALYPSADTVPVNLLKIYIRFSKQMQEGVSPEQIVLIRNNRDTVVAPFLNLQPELWNHERTILTLWLDPGRVKRDLQPNLNSGAPLLEGESYELVIIKGWQDAFGAKTATDYRKKFRVGRRDSVSPNINLWKLELPKSATKEPLIIKLNEPLDFVLLGETIFVHDEKGTAIPGEIETFNKENALRFLPSSPWKPGTYSIVCEFRLEDLAGNNLARLFDRDLNKDKASSERFFKLEFKIPRE